jgi:hypothetical protein
MSSIDSRRRGSLRLGHTREAHFVAKVPYDSGQLLQLLGQPLGTTGLPGGREGGHRRHRRSLAKPWSSL